MRSNYERLGRNFSKRSWVQSGEVVRQLEQFTSQIEGAIWLEVGSGAGDFTALLARRGRMIISLDLSANMLKDACRRYPVQTSAIQADVHRCPFPQGTFDVVAARNVLKHCRNVRLAVAEMRRVCAQNGHLLVVESCVTDEIDRRFMNSVIAVTEPEQRPFLTALELIDLIATKSGYPVSIMNFTSQVTSAVEYRTEQYNMNRERLRQHWDLFSEAPAAIKERREIIQMANGTLQFLLYWTAVVVLNSSDKANPERG